ncbi:hypothetical protein MHBO_001003 [Bonamia ostreae]|uniref:Uncharacterized protein n=1 Tax=Bonamia ostreae TaxID=126728 RepID=A0ABV2AI72_9EUKA
MGTLYTKIWTILDSKNKIADFCKNLCPLNKENGFNVDLIESGLNATVYCQNKKFVKIGNKFFDSVELKCYMGINYVDLKRAKKIDCEKLDLTKCTNFSKESILDYHYECNIGNNGQIKKLNFQCTEMFINKIINIDWKEKVLTACRSFIY